jgi:hypothetical protein
MAAAQEELAEAATLVQESHDGSVPGVLAWMKGKFFPRLGKGNETTEEYRHAENVVAITKSVQLNMDALGVKKRVDEPIQQR